MEMSAEKVETPPAKRAGISAIESDPLKNQAEIQADFDTASNNKVQHYHWIPPEWKPDLKLPDNSKDYDPKLFPENVFGHFDGPSSVAQFVANRRQAGTEDKQDADPEQDDEISSVQGKVARRHQKWPNPLASTEHEDKDGNLLPKDRVEWRRISLIFEWAVLRAIITLNDINKALANEPLEDFDGSVGTDQRTKYNAARANYLSFLKDLDERQVIEKKGGHHQDDDEAKLLTGPDLTKKLDSSKQGRKSGYGRSVKWIFVAPVIHQHKIKAARIIMVWNPHSSSLGVPVLHA